MAKKKGHVAGGACPHCGSVDTEIVVDGNSAYGRCKSCGFYDQRITAESDADLELVVQLAKQTFSQVVVGDADTSMPTVSELAHDISHLMRIVCRSFECTNCPLHEAEKGSDPGEYDEGGFESRSKLKVMCQDQVESRCFATIAKNYPALAPGY